MKNIDALESHIAHLEHTVNELSEVVARQDREIAQLTQRVNMLLTREAEREAAAPGAVYLGDEKPPHY